MHEPHQKMTDMTLTLENATSGTPLNLSCIWTLKEKRKGVWIPRIRRKNLFTAYGLSQFASALGDAYVPPEYLVLEPGVIISSIVQVGATIVTVSGPLDALGDTDLVLSPGQPNQEILPFIAAAPDETGHTVYQLASPATKDHPVGERACRQVYETDTMMEVIDEFLVNLEDDRRIQTIGGYPSGTGSYTLQFFIPALPANSSLASLGLSESPLLGGEHLHNHLVFGYLPPTNEIVDLEIDVALTLANG